MGFLSNLSAVEWVIVLLVLLMLFGTKKIVELGRGLGETTRELKNIKQELQESEGKKKS